MRKTVKLIIVGLVLAIVVTVIGLVVSAPSGKNNSNNDSGEPSVPVSQSYVDKQLETMTLRQKVASLLILHTPGADAVTLENFLKTYQPSGLIFMADNIPSTIDQLATTTKQLQSNQSLPYFLAVDEEGGVVKRLAADTYPAAADLKDQSIDATASAFKQRSNLLKQVGLNLNFGIVADVTDDSNSFIYPRVFGGDPASVSGQVSAAVKASKGLTLTTLKHFPGHGETEANSHTSLPVTGVSLDQWQQHDMPSFQSGVSAGADVVMFGQLIYSSVDSNPATLSAKWHEILKDKLGFTGLTITDDMIMLQDSGDSRYSDPVANAVAALKAGNTMLLFVLSHDNSASNIDPNSLIDGIVAAISDGRLSQDLINQDVQHVLSVRYLLSK
jgi:beta-N-acetylhexosaminidase